MAQVLRSSRADVDLFEIWSYIAEDNIAAADRLLDEIDAACQRLAENPMAGHSRDELVPGLRSYAVRKYLVFYLPTPEGVAVARVLHGAQDLKQLL